MTKKIEKPTEIKAHGNKPKIIQEFIGRVNSNTEDTSIAKMNSPEGWIEPGQTPDFDEYSLVLNGTLCVKTKEETFEVKAGQAIITSKGEWVQYSTPYVGGAEYIAVCLPAFSPQLVHRDDNENLKQVTSAECA
jgi:mannose-6-phosphate isomerase-like protein (cupin superfamily)